MKYTKLEQTQVPT